MAKTYATKQGDKSGRSSGKSGCCDDPELAIEMAEQKKNAAKKRIGVKTLTGRSQE